MDLLNLRKVVTDTLKQEKLLGKYILPNGTQIDAVCVLPDRQFGYNFPPDNYNVTGIEVALVRDGVVATQNLGGDLQEVYAVTVYLKLWGNIGDLIEASKLVNRQLHCHDYFLEKGVFVAGDAGKKVLPTWSVRVREVAISSKEYLNDLMGNY